MKRLALILLILFSMVAPYRAAMAESPELLRSYQQYKTLKAQGKFAEAVPYARTVLKLAEQELGPTHKSFATLLNNLG